MDAPPQEGGTGRLGLGRAALCVCGGRRCGVESDLPVSKIVALFVYRSVDRTAYPPYSDPRLSKPARQPGGKVGEGVCCGGGYLVAVNDTGRWD